jgi:type IV pilus biogenesis protein CpaD/CtpE
VAVLRASGSDVEVVTVAAMAASCGVRPEQLEAAIERKADVLAAWAHNGQGPRFGMRA